MKYTYANNTGCDIRDFHTVIMAAINNGGVLPEELADLFVLVKAPEGSDAAWVLNAA